MKLHYVLGLALAAALTAAPAFAQEDKTDTSKAQEQTQTDKDKAVKPADKDKSKDDKAAARDTKPADRHDTARMPQSDQESAAQDKDKDNKDRDMKDRDMKAEGREGKTEVTEKDRSTHFTIKQDAREKLRSHYGNVRRESNVTIVRQQVLPVEVQTVIQPVPMDLVASLGPAPAGFMYGYADGYVFVYDPQTFFVIDVISLF